MRLESKRNQESIVFKIPTELWDHILSFIPNSFKSITTHSLLIIFHQRNEEQSINIISNQHLFHSILIYSHSQLKLLINSIQSDQTLKTLPRTFSLKTWRLKDNHLLINFLNSISLNLRSIDLHLGPLFAPDQLEEIFENPKSNLKILSLRFNQNVSKRSYEPFLKGAYFDSTIDLISKWSIKSTSLRSFSFIQDPAPPLLQKKKIKGQRDDQGGIAQPIILFRFESFKNFTFSEIGNRIEDLRFRIPNRNLLPSLTQKPSTHLSSSRRLSRLKTLDLSTTSLNHSSILTLLRTYPSIEHLILDRTHLIVPVRFDADQERVTETLKNIGMSVATVGVSRALDANRAWREVVEEVQLQRNLILMKLDSNRDRPLDSSQDGTLSSGSRSALNSRRSTHTRVKKPGRSAFASGPMKPSSTSTSDSSLSRSKLTNTSDEILEMILPNKIVILPSRPKLKTLSCGTSKIKREVRDEWKEWFEEGYQEGLERFLQSSYEKIREFERNFELWKSKLNGIEDEIETRSQPMILKFNDDEEEEEDDENSNEMKKIKLSKTMEEFLYKFKLRISSVEESLMDLNLIESEMNSNRLKIPIFCSIPDCKSLGKVVWNQDEKERNLIRIGEGLNQVENLQESLKEEVEDEKEEEFEDEVEKEEDEHVIGCGHLLNRKIWDSEYW